MPVYKSSTSHDKTPFFRDRITTDITQLYVTACPISVSLPECKYLKGTAFLVHFYNPEPT